ncbi:MAG TPA: SRPBCC family protein [Rhizomicrobium sp.]|jgi:uncharacterized protein YndB with AHSA1/START domain
MTKTITIAPVRKTLTVNATQAHAFTVFTGGIDRWWPKTHQLGKAPLARTVIEPRQGGRWYTIHEDGEEITVGHMLVWDEPNRIVFSWEIDSEWKPDAKVASEVEVRFTAEGTNVTRVELEHRKFEVLGEAGGEKMRSDVGGGWPRILDLFKQEAEA